MRKHWAFTGKKSNQINGPFKSQWQALVVWGIPSYLGWFLGCRDRYEVIEQTSKFLTFLAGYFWTPKFVKGFMERRHRKLLAEGTPVGGVGYNNAIKNVSKTNP